MKTLVKKDIHLIGNYNIFIIIVCLGGGFASFITNKIDLFNIVSLWVGIISIYLILEVLTAQDRITKDIILKSLPIDRKDIVLSRYITMLIYVICISIVIFLSSFIFGFYDDIFIIGNAIPILTLIFNIFLSIVFTSIILPVDYLSGKINRVLNKSIFSMTVIFPIIISKIDNGIIKMAFKYIGNWRLRINPVIYVLLGITLYYLSFLISAKLYKS